MKYIGLTYALFTVWLSTTFCALATDYEARLRTSRDDSVKPSRDTLQVEFWDDKGNQGYIIVTSLVTSPSSYELLGKKGDASTTLDIAQVRSVPAGGPALNLVITPKEPLDIKKYDAFYFHPKDSSVWKLMDGGTWHYEGGGFSLVMKTGQNTPLGRDASHYQRYSGLQNNVDASHNLKGSVLSLNFHYEARSSDESTAPGAFVLLFNAKGDFVLPTKDKTSFYNSLNMDVDYVYSHLPQHPQENRWEPYWDIGADGKAESDQSFDNVNILCGAVTHVILRNPITDGIQRGILLNEPLFLNPKHIVDATVAPLLTFRYDLVDHLKESKDVHTGENRLTASLFYRLPLARGIDFPQKLGLTKQVFDTDFLAELEGVYDIDKQVFTNNSKLTLDFRPETDIEHQPSFTLTYARGKASPTFKNFDAFLAGLKIPF